MKPKKRPAEPAQTRRSTTESITAAQIAEGLGSQPAGPDKWTALCPAHDDRTPSLSIGVAANGRPLVYCHAGCDQDDVIDALRSRGLWHTSTGPAQPRGPSRRELADLLCRESFVLALSASDLLADQPVDADRARVALSRTAAAGGALWP